MDPITLSIAALVATMSRARWRDNTPNKGVISCEHFTPVLLGEKIKKLSDENLLASHGIRISCVPSSDNNSSNVTSEEKPKPSATSEQKKETKTVKKVTRKKRVEPEADEKFVMAVVERVKAELPSLIEKFNDIPSQTLVSETYDAIYRSQIAAAQEFLNENRNADLSRVKCLLHKLLPKEYFEYIEQLREHQDPQTIINIMGGQNIVAPNAKSATQTTKRCKNQKKKS